MKKIANIIITALFIAVAFSSFHYASILSHKSEYEYSKKMINMYTEACVDGLTEALEQIEIVKQS